MFVNPVKCSVCAVPWSQVSYKVAPLRTLDFVLLLAVVSSPGYLWGGSQVAQGLGSSLDDDSCSLCFVFGAWDGTQGLSCPKCVLAL